MSLLQLVVYPKDAKGDSEILSKRMALSNFYL